jgi:hypothetical protein
VINLVKESKSGCVATGWDGFLESPQQINDSPINELLLVFEIATVDLENATGCAQIARLTGSSVAFLRVPDDLERRIIAAATAAHDAVSSAAQMA